MNENKSMKTPEPPKMSVVDINALKAINSRPFATQNRKQLRPTDNRASQMSSTKTMNSTHKFRTPSSTTSFFSKPSFGASTGKQTSKSEDLQTRYQRLENSGLLRKIRGLNSLDEDETDEESKSNTHFKYEEANSCEQNKSNADLKSKKSLNDNFSAADLNKYMEALKNKKSTKWMTDNGLKSTKDLQISSNVQKEERSAMRHSKSEPELAAKNCDQVDKGKPSTEPHKTTESKPSGSAAVVKSSSMSKLSGKESELKSFKINEKMYYKLNKIGSGGSSVVYQVYEPITQKTLALKVVDLSKVDETTQRGFMNEIKLLNRLRNCERVVKLHDHCKLNKSQLIMIMEKGDSDLGCILRQFVETKNKYSLDPLVIKHYWKEMLKAVDEIHNLDIVHSDLKPVNFISVGGKLKLIDFGIANAIDADHTSIVKDNQIGTVNYMAPESLKQLETNPGRKVGKPLYKFNCKADIWSLGCILYNLVYGKAPFAHLTSLIGKVQAICDSKFVIEYPSYDNHLVIDCIKLCLNRDPQKRPTAAELLKHPYLLEGRTESPNSSELTDILRTINSLTPKRMSELSKVIASLSKNK